MSAYFIANYTVTNPDAYQSYLQVVGPTLAPFGAKILVAGGGHSVKEGEPAPVTIVLEFESHEKAEGWYNSDAYQEIINRRLENTEGWVVIAEQWQG